MSFFYFKGDAVASRNRLEKFKNLDHTLGQSREGVLLEGILAAIDNLNQDEFAEVCAEYNRITPLDAWKTHMLIQAKHHIANAAGDGDVDLT